MSLTSTSQPLGKRLGAIETARRSVIEEQATSAPGVEPWIERSWRRCLGEGRLPQERVGFDLITSQAMRRTSESSRQLAIAARPQLDKLMRAIAQTNYFAILTNAEGVVVDTGGPIDRQDPCASVITRVGVDLSERAIGTSAIGAALSELQPVWLHRGEHFFADTSMYSCAGAPIFDPDGNCAGMLDVTGIRTVERPELRHMVAHFSRGIENALVTSRPHALMIRLNWPGRATGHDDDGMVCLDEHGMMMGANSSARNMLALQTRKGEAIHANELFALQSSLLFDAAKREGRSIEVPLWTGLRVLLTPYSAKSRPHYTAGDSGIAPREEGPTAPLKEMEDAMIIRAVNEAGGNVTTAARKLGISRATVYRKLAAKSRKKKTEA